MKKNITRVIFVASLLINILGVIYILKKDVYIVFKNHYYLGRRYEKEVNYNEINREADWVTDGDMALKLIQAYLGDRLNYSKESDSLFTTTVSFDEEKYEYLVQITIKQRGGIYAGTEERFLVGIRKDYGIVTFYDQ